MVIDKKVVTFLLMFDFSKVFDTIPSSKLLVKLRREHRVLQNSPSVDQIIPTRPIPTCSVENQLIQIPIHDSRSPTGVCSGAVAVLSLYQYP